MRLNKTILTPLLMMFFAGAVWLAIPYGISNAIASGGTGPDTFPRLACIAIIILCALQLILVFLGKKPSQYVEFTWLTHGKVVIAMAIALCAVAAMQFVNILLVAVLASELFLVLLRAKKPIYYVAVLITGGILYLMMYFVMNVRF